MFDGTTGAKEVEQWIHRMDLIFETIDYNDTEKRRLAVFQLIYVAVDWWEIVKATVGKEAARTIAWPTFKD